MIRQEVIKHALSESGNKIDTLDIPFFYNLFNLVYQAGVESERGIITGEVLVCEGSKITVCDDERKAAKKFGYDRDCVLRHLRSGLPAERGHVFKWNTK